MKYAGSVGFQSPANPCHCRLRFSVADIRSVRRVVVTSMAVYTSLLQLLLVCCRMSPYSISTAPYWNSPNGVGAGEEDG